MINFGQLNKVNRTYTREGGAVRTQEYTGLKFRRAITDNAKKKAEAAGVAPEADAQFYISNALFNKLEIGEKNGLIQFDRPDGTGVMLAVVSETHPDCKIFKSNARGAKKSKMFYAPVLTEALTKAGVLNADFLGNQYLQLKPVTDVAEVPDFIVGLYDVVMDTDVAAKESGADDEQDEQEAHADAKNAGEDF